LLLVCEDNGLGISVPTPSGWVEATVGSLPHIRYLRPEPGLDAYWSTCEEAIASCRSGRRPVFLHLPTVRLFGPAGSGIETGDRPQAEIEAGEARDPLLENARTLVELGAATPQLLLEILDRVDAEVAALSAECAASPPLATREAVMEPLAPYD